MTKKSFFESGLEGIIVAETEISEVDGANGRLFYRGGNEIGSLVSKKYEEIAYLLLYGIFPSTGELSEITNTMSSNRLLNESALAALAGLPSSVDPMSGLRTVLSAFGAGRGSEEVNIREALILTAISSTIVAAIYRKRLNLPYVLPRDDLSHVANFLYMLSGDEPDESHVRWLETYFVVTADHALSPSTFTAQVVGSTGSDLWSSIVAAVGALKGPAHGGAITEATTMLRNAENSASAENFVTETLDNGERLMGFGHREYKKYDPRAAIFSSICKEANPDFYDRAIAIENVALRELSIRSPNRKLFTNMDYYAGGVLSALDIPIEMFSCIFAASRVLGWSAHVIEYVEKGERIVSPASRWVGPELG